MTIADDEREEISRAEHRVFRENCEACFLHRRLDEARIEIEWLRRLLLWTHPRLKHGLYRESLERYLSAGPSPAPEDEPAVVPSGLATPLPTTPEDREGS